MKITARTYQRWTRCGDVGVDKRPQATRPTSANKLSTEEREQVLRICHDPRYASLPPGQIVPKLADNGEYIASESSFYRILHAADEQHHRGRSQKPHISTPPKGFCATGPNQVWSWDITYLPTCIRGLFFYLYIVADIFSRKIVGWEVHSRESAEHAAVMLQKAIISEGCILSPPVLHSDNGAPQRSLTLRANLEALGVTTSFSRPHVSDDNPYSDALFRTTKYRPDYPYHEFESIDLAREWSHRFVNWYNHDHQHSAIRYVSPSLRHRGKDPEILSARKLVYEAARNRHPERWTGNIRNWEPITEVWLNPPADADIVKRKSR